MNDFIASSKRLIYKHGVDIDYIRTTQGVYDVETGSVTNTESTTTVKAFPKVVRVNSYNYPNLIGKQVVEFLVVCEDLGFSPNISSDKITFNTDLYTIENCTHHTANGALVIYKILATKA